MRAQPAMLATRCAKAICASMLAVAGAGVHGATPPSAPTISISTLKNPVTLQYRPFYAAALKFDELHSYAPQAGLKFHVELENKDIEARDKTLRLIGDTVNRRIDFDEQGTFDLPLDRAASDEDAELELNRRAGPTKVWFHFVNAERLGWTMGRVRLMCEVILAFQRADRAMSRSRSAKANCKTFSYRFNDSTQQVFLRDGQHIVELEMRDSTVLWPTGDSDWPDNTEVILWAGQRHHSGPP